jgi:hypothetical protein
MRLRRARRMLVRVHKISGRFDGFWEKADKPCAAAAICGLLRGDMVWYTVDVPVKTGFLSKVSGRHINSI